MKHVLLRAALFAAFFTVAGAASAAVSSSVTYIFYDAAGQAVGETRLTCQNHGFYGGRTNTYYYVSIELPCSGSGGTGTVGGYRLPAGLTIQQACSEAYCDAVSGPPPGVSEWVEETPDSPYGFGPSNDPSDS